MNQVARPASDVSNNGWTPQIVFTQIKEVTPDDGATYVSSSAAPQGDNFEVQFPKMAWPEKSQGTLQVRLKRDGPDQVPVTICLLQGDTVIAATTVYPGAAYATETLTLTQADLAFITDYTDLRLRVIAGYTVQTGCCPNQGLPAVLHVTVTNKTGGAVCFPDSFLLVGSTLQWVSASHLGSCSSSAFTLQCQGGTSCNSFLFASTLCGSARPDAGCRCDSSKPTDPLHLVFTISGIAGICCNGTPGSATFTVTE